MTEEKQQLIDRWPEFLAAWPEHKVGVNLGSQSWISLIDTGVITASNIREVFAGLERWKNSEQWARGFIPAIANVRGAGWLQVRAWEDWPKAKETDSWAS